MADLGLCKKCGANPRFRARDGRCRPCKNARDREYGVSNREQISVRGKEYRQANLEDISAKAAVRYAKDREENRAKRREYYAENSEACKARVREYQEKNAEQIRAKAKARYSASDKEKHAEKGRQWRANNVERARELSRLKEARRRARKHGATCPEFAEEDLLALLPWCVACGGEAEHVDHIVPLSGGGCSGAHNLQWLCAPCNLKKHTTSMRDFLGEAAFREWKSYVPHVGCPVAVG